MEANNLKTNYFELNSIGYVKKGTKKQTYQDRMNSKTFDDGISIVALADGLGSKSKSDKGAEIAVDTAIETLYELFENLDVEHLAPDSAENLKKVLLERIKQNISIEAGTSNLEKLKEYACTLLFAVMKDNRIALGQIGDGYIVIKKNNGVMKLAFDPKNDSIEHANGTETIFSKPKHMHLAAGKRDEFEYIFLSSDGTDKLINGQWRGMYTPFITGKNQGRKPQPRIFEYMGTLLKQSKEGSISYKDYPEDETNNLASMLIDNRLDDDVTFCFFNPNEKGPTRRVSDLLEMIRSRGISKNRNVLNSQEIGRGVKEELANTEEMDKKAKGIISKIKGNQEKKNNGK